MDDAMKLRLAAFERMLEDADAELTEVVRMLEEQKSQGRTKTVTFKQLLASKMQLSNLMQRYRDYGLIQL